jgi:hypothetical protein
VAAAELELAPLVVEPLFARSGDEAPGADSRAEPPLGPVTTPCEPESEAPALSAAPEDTEIEVPPLAATGLAEPAIIGDPTPHALELDPIPIELAPSAVPLATSTAEATLSSSSPQTVSPETVPEPATAASASGAPVPAATDQASAVEAATRAAAPVDELADEGDAAPHVLEPPETASLEIAPELAAAASESETTAPAPEPTADAVASMSEVGSIADAPTEGRSEAVADERVMSASVEGATPTMIAATAPLSTIAPPPELPAEPAPEPAAAQDPFADAHVVALVEVPAVAPPEEQAAELPAASEHASLSAAPAEPAPETDMLAAEWEPAVMREDVTREDWAAVASPPAADPPVTAMEAEPADFLLEPLSPPATAISRLPPEPIVAEPPPAEPPAAEPPPGEPSAEAIMEIEQELFVLDPPRSAPEPVAAPRLLQAEPVAAAIEQPVVAPAISPARPAVSPVPRPAASDPLAALRALSDEERIAVFS